MAAWCGFDAAGHPPYSVPWWTTVTNGNFNMFTARSARRKANWTGGFGPVMNTEAMGFFLAQVSAAHPDDFIVMVVDGASSHVAKALVVPENIRLHRLPGDSPELK